MARTRKKGVSWQLIGIAAVLAVLVIGGIVSMFGDGGSDGVVPPIVVTDDDTVEVCTDPDGRPCLGSDDAPVTFYEFADFQCPHCKDHSQIYARSIKRDYIATGKAKLVWVNFAFQGAESTDAAAAALCANDQGEFWNYHDWLFENQAAIANTGGFSRARLELIAGEAGLDVDAFKACMADGEMADRVADDVSFARESGIESTPSFIVGESKIEGSGDQSVDALRSAIDAASGG